MKIISIIILSVGVAFAGICACESTDVSVDELAVEYCELFVQCSPNFGPTSDECIQAVHDDLFEKEGECYSKTVDFLECLANLSCEKVGTEILESCYEAQDRKLGACK